MEREAILLALNQQLQDRRVNVDVILSELSIGVTADQDLIGDQILKPLPQELSSVLIATHGSEGFALIEDATGDWAEPKRIDIVKDKIRVDVEGHALAGLVSVRHQVEASRSQLGYDLKAEVAGVVKQNMLLKREEGQATLLQNSAVYTAAGSVVSVTGTSQWNDATSDPFALLIPHVEETLPNLIGRRPNTMWMGQQVWTKLITHAKVQNRIYGSQAPQSLPSVAQIAALFGVDRIFVGRAVWKNAAGTATRIWGKNLGLAWVPPTAGRMIPSFGYTAEQTVFNGSHEAIQTDFDPKAGPAGADYVKRGAFYTPSITYAAAGMLFTTVVA